MKKAKRAYRRRLTAYTRYEPISAPPSSPPVKQVSPMQEMIAKANHMTAHLCGLAEQLQGFTDELYGPIPQEAGGSTDVPSPQNLTYATDELARAVLRVDQAVARLLMRN